MDTYGVDLMGRRRRVDGDIRIELHRSGTTVNVVWPAAAAAECAAWLRDWLR